MRRSPEHAFVLLHKAARRPLQYKRTMMDCTHHQQQWATLHHDSIKNNVNSASGTVCAHSFDNGVRKGKFLLNILTNGVS